MLLGCLSEMKVKVLLGLWKRKEICGKQNSGVAGAQTSASAAADGITNQN